MILHWIKIKNFRGIDLNISGINMNTAIIGNNDSGKSTLINAILHLLDRKTRAKPLYSTDSTNLNNEEIIIEAKFNFKEVFSPRLSKFLDASPGYSGALYIKSISIFSEELDEYETEITIGEFDNWKFSNRAKLPFDDLLSLVFLPPTIENDIDNQYIRNHIEKKDFNVKDLEEKVSGQLSDLNKNVLDSDIGKSVKKELNGTLYFNKELTPNSVGLTTKIDHKNITRSLVISHFLDGNKLEFIGDFSRKALNLAIRESQNNDRKYKMFILEEPENHAHFSKMKYILNGIDKTNNFQIIYSTHSPELISNNKLDSIIDMDSDPGAKIFTLNKLNSSHFRLTLLKALSIALFSERILLVEGLSERHFYDYLYQENQGFADYIDNKNIVIIPIGGINFKPLYKILMEMGKKVRVLTDADLYATTKEKNNWMHHGYRRLYRLLGIDLPKSIELSYSTEDEALITIDWKSMIGELMQHGLYIGSPRRDFEESLKLLLGLSEEDVTFLRAKKLINLNRILSDKISELKVLSLKNKNILIEVISEWG